MLCAVMVMMASSSHARQGFPLWPDFQVNENEGRCNHYYVATDVGPKGHAVLVWLDRRNAFDRLFFQRYDDTGSPQASNTNVGVFSDDRPAVAVDSAGAFVVVWEDVLIYGQMFDADGNAAGDVFTVTDASAFCSSQSVSMDSLGNFVVAWVDYRNSNRDIYAQRYDSSGNPLGVNFRVNDDLGTSSQYDSWVSMDSSGNFVVVWRDRRDGNYNIYAQCYDSSGNPMLSNFKVNDDPGTSSQYSPSVSMASSGQFVVAWQDYRNGDSDIYAQLYDPGQMVLPPNFRVNGDLGSASQYDPSASMDSSGDFVIAWEDHRSGNGDIYAQCYDSVGNAVGSELVVNDDAGEASQHKPMVSSDPEGNLLVAWHDYRNGMRNVYAQRYDAGGGVSGVNFLVNDDVGSSAQNDPSISMNSSGEFIVAWHDYRSGNGDIYLQRYDSSGNPIETNFMANDDGGTSSQSDPSVSLSPSGSFVVAWQDARNGNADIYARRYDSFGNPLDDSFRVNDDVGTGWQYAPVVAVGPDGEFVVVWEDHRNGDWDVYARCYDSSGSPLGGSFLVNDEDFWNRSQDTPSVAKNSSGKFVVVWQDERDENYDIYAQRFNASGATIGLNILLNDDGGFESQYDPSVSLDSSGNFVVVWEDYRNGNVRSIRAQRCDSNGILIGANVQVNDSPASSLKYPSVCMNSSGKFVVAWEDGRGDPTDIYAQRYLSDGSPDGVNWKVNTDRDSAHHCDPYVAGYGSRAVFTWYDNRTPGQSWDIWANGCDFSEWNFFAEVEGGDIVLRWSEAAEADSIFVFRDSVAYFQPDMDGFTNRVASLSGDSVQYSDPYGVGDPDNNAFYRIVAWNELEGELFRSGTVGEFDFLTAIPPR